MVALAVALGVVGGAGVDAAIGTRHLLQHEALVRDDHLLGHVVAQLAALKRIDIKIRAKTCVSGVSFGVSSAYFSVKMMY